MPTAFLSDFCNTTLKNTLSKLNPLDDRLEFEFGQFVIGEGSGER